MTPPLAERPVARPLLVLALTTCCAGVDQRGELGARQHDGGSRLATDSAALASDAMPLAEVGAKDAVPAGQGRDVPRLAIDAQVGGRDLSAGCPSFGCDARPSTEATPHGKNLYTYYAWPASSRGYYNVDAVLTVLAVEAQVKVFWAHQVWMRDGPVAYLGLQNQGNLPDRLGKLAIFSIWDATRARGAHCQRFGGEGVGLSCRVPYEWVVGHSYRLRLWATTREAEGQWWGAWVIDLRSGDETFIGEIRAPLGAGWIESNTVSFTEYFGGSLPNSVELPPSRVHWQQPTADNGTVTPRFGG